jgi:DNA segregation ATPase FtsK/SpoIIIE, S-DNA-T family
MAKRKRRQSRNKNLIKQTIQFELVALLLIAIAIISLANMGKGGHTVVLFFRFFLGEWYFLGPIGMIIYGGYLMWKRQRPILFSVKLMGLYIIIASIMLLTHIPLFELPSNGNRFGNPSVLEITWDLFMKEARGQANPDGLGGGMAGAVLFVLFYFLFDEAGTKLFAIVLMMIGFILFTGKTFGGALNKIFSSIWVFSTKQWLGFKEDMNNWRQGLKEKREMKHAQKYEKRARLELENQETRSSPIIHVATQAQEESIRPEPIISNFADRAYQQNDEQKTVVEDVEEVVVEEDLHPIAFTEVENVDYQLPSIDLLKQPRHTDQSGEYALIHENAAKLERTFQSFGVKANVTQVHLGPAVTKYEVHPDAGVKVSKIVSLTDDLALALAAKDIRMEAPIPGKSAIGIEVPNSEVAIVSLREVLESKKNDKPEAKLLIGLGRDITGEAVLTELNKMPHLLVAGATGSGKSVCINGIITSILMRAKPHEVKMMMIDPKMVELNVYNGIPHLLAPVVTNAKKASQALQKVVNEMERRYELFAHSGTRNIEGFNEHIRRHNAEEEGQQPLLPYIVVIVDELADLMMVASSDVEDSITRLAQMARAAGIHLIIATQRPSVDVITGVIKANIPSRIAFAVSSSTDSRTILDMGGAEKLLGRGDMLFFPVGSSKPVRVQGAFLSDEEVEEVVEFVIDQQKAQYQEDMIPDDIPEKARGKVEDEIYGDAVDLVLEMQTASVSMLQRRFRIGYTRAARLIDEMEARGIVGPYEGSKPRTVLMGKPSEEVSS